MMTAKIGVFDSGLGGLFTLKALRTAMPEYDYVYLGDTKRVPYGSRSHETIYQFLTEGLEFLFSRNCSLVIVACNTASAEALRRVQQEWLPVHHPDKKVLGMIVPLAEACEPYEHVGVIGTEATIGSKAYERECALRAPRASVVSIAAPLLVPLIEANDMRHIDAILEEYLAAFNEKDIQALVLACTHYPIIEDHFQKLLPAGTVILSQETVVPQKTKQYLARHSEIQATLSKNSSCELCVTDVTEHLTLLAARWFGAELHIEKVTIEK